MTYFAHVLSTTTPVSDGELRSSLSGIAIDDQEYLVIGDRSCFLHTFRYLSENNRFERVATFKAHNGWISCLSYMKPCDSYPNGAVISSSHDYTVKVWDLPSIIDSSKTEHEPARTFCHEGQVCFVQAINDGSGRIISSGWDSTCRVWDPSAQPLIMKHEKYAIWSATEIPCGFLTCGADHSIRLWSKSGELIKKIDEAHTDVIRDSVYISSKNLFVTCSNDGMIKEWLVEGATINNVGSIYCSNTYLYSLCLLDNDTYVVSSEDRCAYIASSKSQKVEDLLPLPDVVWSSAVLLNKDVLCTCADGFMRTFTNDQSRRCDQETEEHYLKRLQSLTFSNPELQQTNPLDLQDFASLSSQNGTAGSGTLVRDGEQMVVCTWSNGYNRWIKIGSVVLATDGETKNKVSDAKGNVWDYCFNVELETGQSYPLYINHDTNAYTAAYNFMAEHELDPRMYLNQIVEFINKNRKNVVVSSEANNKPFPMTTPSFLDEINVAPIINKIKTLNGNAEHKLTEEQINVLSAPLSKEQFEVIEFTVKNWPPDQYWPFLDILRVSILDLTARGYIPANRLVQLVRSVSSVSAQDAPEFLILMLMRVITNMFKNFTSEVISDLNLMNLYQKFSFRYSSASPRTQVAFSAAILNTSIYLSSDSDRCVQVVELLVSLFANQMDTTALHRLIYAAGNVVSFSDAARFKLQMNPEIFSDIRSKCQLPQNVEYVLTALGNLISV